MPSVTFEYPRNCWLVLDGQESNNVYMWQNDDLKPEYTLKAEVQYYMTKGRTKPIARVADNVSYVEGRIAAWFLDTDTGKVRMEAFMTDIIRNYSPMYLKTQYGDVLRIQIDSDIMKERKEGVGYEVSFRFKEVESE